ncbi:hypothetical protein J2Y86_001699 [Pseudomonas migulae]|nr:hypothetical protein [Pseudomonas migulae]
MPAIVARALVLVSVLALNLERRWVAIRVAGV